MRSNGLVWAAMPICGAVLALGACASDGEDADAQERLRPATEAECPQGGTVLERDHGRKDVVCEGDQALPEDEEFTCESVTETIQEALREYSDAGYFGADSEPCGDGGIAAGVASWDERYPEEQRARLAMQFAEACRMRDELCD